MAKNSIRDYSAINSSNTDIQSIDISEGCSPAGINNAIREIMADLKDVSTGAVALESPAFDSASLTGDLTFGDNDKAIFGAGSDLQIYSDGSTSYITEAGPGNLRINGASVQITDTSFNKYFQGSGDTTRLYYADGEKLATTATGVDVTGTVTATGNTLLTGGNYYLGALAGTDRAYVGWATGNGMSVWNVQNSFIQFGTNNTEQMRIAGSGRVLMGGTTVIDSARLNVYASSSNATISTKPLSNVSYEAVTFRNFSGTYVGYISVSASSTSYITSSDYRLKENVVADWDATTRLKQLNPVRFNFIADPDTTVDGFLAHEVQSVVPEAITGTHNGMRDEEYEVTPAVLDEDGNEVTPAVMGTRSVPDYQGIDQSKLVPLLVKTIQELEARITALEAN